MLHYLLLFYFTETPWEICTYGMWMWVWYPKHCLPQFSKPIAGNIQLHSFGTWMFSLTWSGGHLNIKMPSYQYRDSHVKDKTVSPTVLSLTWDPHTWERRSLYWDGAQVSIVWSYLYPWGQLKSNPFDSMKDPSWSALYEMMGTSLTALWTEKVLFSRYTSPRLSMMSPSRARSTTSAVGFCGRQMVWY